MKVIHILEFFCGENFMQVLIYYSKYFLEYF